MTWRGRDIRWVVPRKADGTSAGRVKTGAVSGAVAGTAVAAAAAGAGENGFTFGLLYAREANIAESAQQAYPSAFRAAANKRVRRWMQ